MADTQSGKKVTIKLPSNASELNVEQYLKFLKVDGDTAFKMLKVLEIFANIPLKVAYAMKADDVLEFSTHILSLLDKTYPLKRVVNYRGKEFGFIPNLEDISFGEYIDLDTYLGDVQNLHKALGVLYRPITKRNGEFYEIEPYSGNQSLTDFPLDAALGATLFFYRLRSKLLTSTATSSQVLEQTSPHSGVSQGSGGGTVA